MSVKSLLRAATLASWVLIASACGSDTMATTGTGGFTATGGMTASAPSFSQIKSEILDPTCNFLGCHQNPTTAGNSLNMAVDPYNALLGTSTTVQRPFVTPGNVASSYLIEKLQSLTPASGDRMPVGVPLTDTQIMMISDWIAAGALNN